MTLLWSPGALCSKSVPLAWLRCSNDDMHIVVPCHWNALFGFAVE
jgi:hypothetical protein